MLTRREMIRRGFFAPAILAAAKGVAAQDISDIVLNPSPAVVPFTRRLKIPRAHLPLNRPGATSLELAKAQSIVQQCTAEDRFRHPGADPCDIYEVVMKPGLQEILPGTLTPISGYNGTYPGPTFLAERDRASIIRFVNRIGTITSVHYHGGHTRADERLSQRQSVSGDALVSRPRRGRHRRERLSRPGRLLPARSQPVGGGRGGPGGRGAAAFGLRAL
jgi:hypothetical protein